MAGAGRRSVASANPAAAVAARRPAALEVPVPRAPRRRAAVLPPLAVGFALLLAAVAAAGVDDRAATTPAATAAPPGAPATPAEPTQEPAEPAPPPPQVVARQAVFDAGKVSRGEKISAAFVLDNRGAGELVVRSVQPTCGCTVVAFDERIAPGASGTIRAEVDTRDLVGSIAKSVTVLSNDPATPRLQLTVKADVRAFVVAQPSYARFVHTQTQPESSLGLTVASPEAADFRVLEAVSPYPHLRATVREAQDAERIADAPGPQWRIELTLAADAPVGPLRDFLRVKTNHPRQPELEIPLSGTVRPVLHLTPGAADFGELSLAGQAREVVLTLVNFGASPVEIRGVTTDVAGAAARFEVVETGKRWKIVVQLGPGIAKGRVDGVLRVETSSPVLPEIEVPVTGRIA
jgi:hypothetical protein